MNLESNLTVHFIQKIKIMKGLVDSINCNSCIQTCTNDFSPDDLLILEKNKKEVQYLSNETIIKQGSFIDNIVFLKSGLIKVIIETETNKNIILKIVSPEKFIGLSAIYLDSYFPVTLVALSKCKVCLIKKDCIQTIIKQNSCFNYKVMKLYSQQYLFLYARIAVMSTRSNIGKLAETLLYLSSEEFLKENIFEHITRKDIADLATISVESMNRILNEFKNDLIIELNNKDIIIKDPALLKRLSVIG